MNFHFPGEILGVRPSNDFLKIGILIRKGLPLYCLKRFREFSGASEAEVRHILWMTEADLQNRERRRRLSSRESDRLFSAVRYRWRESARVTSAWSTSFLVTTPA